MDEPGTFSVSPDGAARLKKALVLWGQAQQAIRHKMGEEGWETLQDSMTKVAHVA